ncbi:MAG: ATP-dependent DNA helicase DinG [Cellvibrionaceae bacterium]|nr:ATP-dependent DNA helicase DinG [Cellvibrionaceae bacterium]
MLTDELKHTIQQAYRQFLDSHSLQPRYGQRLMIADIARVLSDINQNSDGERIASAKPHIAVLEAGTGTGKTLAYLLAAIPVAQALNKKLVVSTATIALQEQIVYKDLPDIKANTDLHFNYTLAKGRGRYLCLSKMERLLVGSDQQHSQTLYEDEYPPADQQTLSLYNRMVDSLAAGEWDGDRDQWSDEIDEAVWRPVTTNHRECTGRRCSNVGQCSFFKARDTMDRFDCIVANHDLVLADLALGGGAILPDPKDTIYIFDEGHHLADKALGHFAYHVRVSATLSWFEQVNKSLGALASAISDGAQIDHHNEQLPAVLADARQPLERLQPLCEQLLASVAEDAGQNRYRREGADKRYRFKDNVLPDEFVEVCTDLHSGFQRLAQLLQTLSELMHAAMEDSFCSVPKVDLETWYPLIGKWLARAEANVALWQSYIAHWPVSAKRPPLARWISLVDFSGNLDYEVCSSPILAADTLQTCLWQPCFGAVVTSATLTALGKYERFMLRAGTDSQQHYNSMPSPFDFSRASLQVPEFAVEANNASMHTESLIEHLPALLQGKQGSLVLFSSRKQMEDVCQQLPSACQKTILMQGDYSKSDMLKRHKGAIDQGRGSVLFGLASFAEGIDLPGDYCAHVIIAKLPFSVPDDPIEASLSEWIETKGGNAFMEISVPDASIRLIQACGRLLRTENDSGTISILDRRLLSKRYGKMLLDALPPYQLTC